ncbi:MAG TPA: hypothetical protein VH590_17830 [Ktedonobacterales bacterium]|jgi:hypothetical protein
MITARRLAQAAKASLVLPFLLAALLGLGVHTHAVGHTSVSISSHQGIAYDDPPPGH